MLRLVLIFVLSATFAHAQTWPQKPVRVIVPFAPGGASDLMPRLVAEKLTAMWAQPVLMENRPGAAGNIGMEAGARAPADGYTLVSAPNGNLVVNPHMYSKLAYDVFRDLAPVTRIAAVQNVLVVHPDVPANSVKELVALARAKPGTLNFASPGNGSQAHVAVELLKLQLGLDLVHVPYQGVGPAMKDLLGGRINVMVAQVPSALPHVQAGKLRALGVASTASLPALPDVPTVAAAAPLPGFEAVPGMPSWRRPARRARSSGRSTRTWRRRCRCPTCASASRAWAPILPARRPPSSPRASRPNTSAGAKSCARPISAPTDACERAHVLGHARVGASLARSDRLGDARGGCAGGVRRARAA